MEIESTDPLEGITPVTLWVRLDSTRLAYIIAVTLSGAGQCAKESEPQGATGSGSYGKGSL